MNRPSLLPVVLAMLMSLCVASESLGETRWWNPRRGYSPFSDKDSVPLVLDNTTSLPLRASTPLSIPGCEFTLSLRAANRHSHPTRRHSHKTPTGASRSVLSPGWSILISGVRGDTLRLRLRSIESEKAGDGISSARAVEITADRRGTCIDGAPVAPLSLLATDLNPDTGWNSFQLIRSGNNFLLFGGIHSQQPLLDITVPLSATSEIGFEAEPSTKLELDFISLATPDAVEGLTSDSRAGASTLAAMRKQAESSSDEMEGEWVIFDRNLDEGTLRMGGDYRLLCLRNGKGYDLYYLSGARTCKADWHEGRLKARLKATPLSNIWDVEWHDAEGTMISRDVRAQYDSQSGLLTVSFPYSASTLRLIAIRE